MAAINSEVHANQGSPFLPCAQHDVGGAVPLGASKFIISRCSRKACSFCWSAFLQNPTGRIDFPSKFGIIFQTRLSPLIILTVTYRGHLACADIYIEGYYVTLHHPSWLMVLSLCLSLSFMVVGNLSFNTLVVITLFAIHSRAGQSLK